MQPKTSINNPLKAIDVVILAGGEGTRLKKVVSDRPKPMAEIAGRPFLDFLIDYVAAFGFKRFILCTGYLSNVIIEHYTSEIRREEILFSNESKPMGTGGAVKNVDKLIRSSPFLTMNGDSFCQVDLRAFFEFHKAKGAVTSIVVNESKMAGDFGLIKLDASQKITGFIEKSDSAEGLVNSGIYLFEREVFSSMPDGNFSLECDFFPKLAGSDIYGFVTTEEMVDIGTPKRLEKATQFLFNQKKSNE